MARSWRSEGSVSDLAIYLSSRIRASGAEDLAINYSEARLCGLKGRQAESITGSIPLGNDYFPGSDPVKDHCWSSHTSKGTNSPVATSFAASILLSEPGPMYVYFSQYPNISANSFAPSNQVENTSAGTCEKLYSLPCLL